ncbi:MAG: hypothetical protein KGY66_06135 [Candidatus Thermoplasmatota archaeon]|nr:hypothetical protein [Candidatus Thermoplasmatota archaeon]MBS3790477.1 hypothetical protein [Candidatus Thermoplasmatota archaeon]
MDEKWCRNELSKPQEEDESHTLGERLWSGNPKKFIKIVAFGQSLLNLWKTDDSNKLSEKLLELKNDTFSNAYYELRCAEYYDKKLDKIEFIETREDIKSPDFRIFSNKETAVVECKKKSEGSTDLENNILDASAQLKANFEGHKETGVIFIELGPEHKIDPEKIEEDIRFYLRNKKWVTGVVLTKERLNELKDERLSYKTESKFIENPNAEYKLPETILDKTKDMYFLPSTSLQERFS